MSVTSLRQSPLIDADLGDTLKRRATGPLPR
jgi:hypothetical protein